MLPKAKKPQTTRFTSYNDYESAALYITAVVDGENTVMTDKTILALLEATSGHVCVPIRLDRQSLRALIATLLEIETTLTKASSAA